MTVTRLTASATAVFATTALANAMMVQLDQLAFRSSRSSSYGLDFFRRIEQPIRIGILRRDFRDVNVHADVAVHIQDL